MEITVIAFEKGLNGVEGEREKKNGVEARHTENAGGPRLILGKGWETMAENIVVGERRGLGYVPGSVTHC